MKIDTLLDYTCWTLLIATIVLLKVAEKMLDNIINTKFYFLEYSLHVLMLSVAVLFLIYKLHPG